MAHPAITVVLNAHREGLIARPSIESLKRAVAHAQGIGHSVEVVVVLDRPDSVTMDVVLENAAAGYNIHKTDFGDLGMARNFAISVATGQYIALLDADDFWCIDWLTRALSAARVRTDPVIWHPEISVYFDAARHIFCHIDMESDPFDATGLVIENYWTSLSFGNRDHYLAHPYPTIDLDAGFGFEDWAWHMETISQGVIHKVVRGTGHVIRRKEISLAKKTIIAQAVPRPNSYLRNVIAQKSSANEYSCRRSKCSVPASGGSDLG